MQCAITSRASSVVPSLTTSSAFKASPKISSGTPITAASLTPGGVEGVLHLFGADLLAAALDDIVFAPHEVADSLRRPCERDRRYSSTCSPGKLPGRKARAVASGLFQ